MNVGGHSQDYYCYDSTTGRNQWYCGWRFNAQSMRRANRKGQWAQMHVDNASLRNVEMYVLAGKSAHHRFNVIIELMSLYLAVLTQVTGSIAHRIMSNDGMKRAPIPHRRQFYN